MGKRAHRRIGMDCSHGWRADGIRDVYDGIRPLLSEHPILFRAIGNNQGRPAPREARSKGVLNRPDGQKTQQSRKRCADALNAALRIHVTHQARSQTVDC